MRVGKIIKTIGRAARFDAAADVTLDELRTELTCPQDAAAGRLFRDHHKAHRWAGRAGRPLGVADDLA